jgi:hypothetical protein
MLKIGSKDEGEISKGEIRLILSNRLEDYNPLLEAELYSGSFMQYYYSKHNKVSHYELTNQKKRHHPF